MITLSSHHAGFDKRRAVSISAHTTAYIPPSNRATAVVSLGRLNPPRAAPRAAPTCRSPRTSCRADWAARVTSMTRTSGLTVTPCDRLLAARGSRSLQTRHLGRMFSANKSYTERTRNTLDTRPAIGHVWVLKVVTERSVQRETNSLLHGCLPPWPAVRTTARWTARPALPVRGTLRSASVRVPASPRLGCLFSL